MKLAKVDATIAKELAQTHGIQGFPTIKFFKNGKATEYNGGRTESEIVSWVNKKSGPAYVTVDSEDALLSLQEVHDAFTLGAFKSLESAAAKSFIELASESEEQIFAVTTLPAILSKLAITEDTVVVLKSFDELRNDLSVHSGFDADAVKLFVSGNTVPLIQVFSQESAKKIFASPIQKHALLFSDVESESHADSLETLKSVAAQFKGKTIFVNVPASEARVFEFFGITKEQMPTLVLADMGAESGMKKYPFSGVLETAALSTFITNVIDGKIAPSLKSEEVVEEDSTGAVTIAKGKSFNDIVINNTKDVLVEFYAPWCGHCKNLAPIWDELGMKYKKEDNVDIVKMDSVANEIDVEGVSVKGFPTIYFFKGDDKTHPVKYEEGRELKDFVAFLKKSGSNKVNHEEL
jgi:protein disulfide-isomerase A1